MDSSQSSVGPTEPPKVLKRHNWSDHEILILINVWSFHIQDLRGIKRNRVIYEKIAKELADVSECAIRPYLEIKNKVGNLTRDYRREKARLVSGASPSSWKFFRPMNELLGSLPANNDSLLEDSLLSNVDISDGSLTFEGTIENEVEIELDDSLLSLPSTSSASSSSVRSSSGPLSQAGKKRKSSTEDPCTEILRDMLIEQKRPNEAAERGEERVLKFIEDDSVSQRLFQTSMTSLLGQLLAKK